MIGSLRRRMLASQIRLCETCGQVCTAACNAQTQRERTRAQAATWIMPVR
jgi:hypothetical protein